MLGPMGHGPGRGSGKLMCLGLGMCLACAADSPEQGGSDGTTAAQQATSAGGSDEATAAPQTTSTAAATTAGTDDSGTAAAEETGSSETNTPADLEPWPSDGCGASTLEPGAHDQLILEHDGVERIYDLYLPQAHNGTDPAPLVLNFHGWTSNSMAQESFSQFEAVAEAAGVVTVYPQGIDFSWNGGLCCGTAMADAVDDVGFVRSLVATLGETLCIDERRTYATGMSNGGFLSYRLACEASDLFAAIAPVAAVLGVDPESCNPERPVPAMHFHGTEDELVLYGGSIATGAPSVPDTIRGWSERNGCSPDGAVTLDVDPVVCETWSGCEHDGSVVLCTAEGVGHCWPGQAECPFGDSTTAVNASEMMVEFFADHPMP